MSIKSSKLSYAKKKKKDYINSKNYIIQDVFHKNHYVEVTLKFKVL